MRIDCRGCDEKMLIIARLTRKLARLREASKEVLRAEHVGHVARTEAVINLRRALRYRPE